MKYLAVSEPFYIKNEILMKLKQIKKTVSLCV